MDGHRLPGHLTVSLDWSRLSATDAANLIIGYGRRPEHEPIGWHFGLLPLTQGTVWEET